MIVHTMQGGLDTAPASMSESTQTAKIPDDFVMNRDDVIEVQQNQRSFNAISTSRCWEMTFRAARSTSSFSVSVEALTSVVGRMIVRGFSSTPYSVFLLGAMTVFYLKKTLAISHLLSRAPSWLVLRQS